MSFLLDSNIIINYLNGKLDRVVLNRLLESKIYISTLVLFEVEFGLIKKGNLDKIRFFKDFIKDTKLEIISVDKKIGYIAINDRIYLEKKGLRVDNIDLLIAATAKSRDLTLMTLNRKHFARIPGLKILED